MASSSARFRSAEPTTQRASMERYGVRGQGCSTPRRHGYNPGVLALVLGLDSNVFTGVFVGPREPLRWLFSGAEPDDASGDSPAPPTGSAMRLTGKTTYVVLELQLSALLGVRFAVQRCPPQAAWQL